MSDGTARQTAIEVLFDGEDITTKIQENLLSLTYTDFEEDQADDLQIKIADRSGVWLRKWLPAAVQSAASSTSTASSGDWKVGDSVIANGRPQYSSYGIGNPGRLVTNHKGKITYLNLKPGIPYPIHVDYLGWFAESEIQKEGGEQKQSGLKIRATIRGWKGKLPCGEFELDSVNASGPPSVVTIKASGLPASAKIRQTKKTKGWESYNLSGIANEIAAANGMTCMFESESDPFYERVEQLDTSDIKFLSELCHDAGLSLKSTDNLLVLFDQAAYEAKEPIFVIGWGSGYTKYRLNTGASDSKYSSCRVSYVDSTGNCIEAIVKTEDYDPQAKDGQRLEIKAKVSSVEEAKVLAEKQLRLHNKFAKTAVFDFPGNPTLVAGLTVKLVDWGLWSGKYIISQATHTVSSSGYTTQIKLRKVLGGY